MAKKKKKDHADIVPVPREAIAGVTCEEDFVELLRRELEWPIPLTVQRLADVAIPHDLQKDFGFRPEENRIAVSRLLNLTEDQPWGVFLFEFKTKRPYLSHLRRLLRILGSQRTLRKGDPIWDRSDLLFICTPDWHQFQFVHFSGEKPENAVISTFGWKGPDDPFLHTLCRHNLPRLRMPKPLADGDYESDAWRTAWRDAFSVKPVTDEFYTTLKEVFDAVQSGVKGLKGEDCRFFAELVVNRMVFLKFVEKKGWLDNDRDYLFNRFQAHGRKNFWQNFLCDFFFEGLCKEKTQRSKAVNELLGDVPFLNAELFAPSDKWDDWAVKIENRVFDLLFDKLLNPYNFTVCETSPLEVEVAFNQDLLGYGYEELIADQHGQGAYYTHPTEVNLMCRESLRAYLEGRCPKMDKELIGKLVYSELTTDDSVCETDALELYQALHDVTVVDPALGSGTFPVAMMKHLFLALRTLGEYLKDSKNFAELLGQDGITDPEDAFALKLHIIERSIYGCDIDYFAVQIAKLRFWIELMVDCDRPEALPNFNCKLVVGDALVSVVGTDNEGNLIILEELLGHPTRLVGQGNILHFIGKQTIERLAELKRQYFKVKDEHERKILENQINKMRNELLRSVGVQPDKIQRTHKHVLWQIDFAEIFSGANPGFDIAIANPPYLRQELIDGCLSEFNLIISKSILKEKYSKLTPASVSGKSDLYIFFFLRTMQLVNQNRGITCFICSNSWMDVDFGSVLKKTIAKHAHRLVIIDNKSLRSFAFAAINTAITIIQAGNNSTKRHPDAVFIMFDVPYSQCMNADCLGKILNLPNVVGYRTEFGRVNILSFSQLYGQESYSCSWGGQYLRAPDFYLELIRDYRQTLVHLGDIATLRFGIKTGANNFFHLDSTTIDNWNIEPEYLMPIIRTPRECKSMVVNWKDLHYRILICNENKTALKGKNVLRYIEWGEMKGYHKRPSCRGRQLWYNINEQMPSDFIMLRFRDQRNWTPIIESQNYAIGDTVFVGAFKNRNLRQVGCAMLNSTLSIMMSEIFGRVNLGDGLLTTYGPELQEMIVVSPEKLLPFRDPLTRIMRDMSKRNVLPIFDEIRQLDRRELDQIIFDSIGIPKNRIEELYNAVRNLVQNRINKAKSK